MPTLSQTYSTYFYFQTFCVLTPQLCLLVMIHGLLLLFLSKFQSIQQFLIFAFNSYIYHYFYLSCVSFCLFLSPPPFPTFCFANQLFKIYFPHSLYRSYIFSFLLVVTLISVLEFIEFKIHISNLLIYMINFNHIPPILSNHC